MSYKKNVYSDNEYAIMSEITENQNITQRKLSRALGVSVSTVNVLMNKMIKEGLIKMTQVSQKQVLYMLTPKGMMEKAKKTVSYLKAHYRAIDETKEKIKRTINQLHQEYDAIFVLMRNDEMDDIIWAAIQETQTQSSKPTINMISSSDKLDINKYQSPVLLHMAVDDAILEKFKKIKALKVINLIKDITP